MLKRFWLFLLTLVILWWVFGFPMPVHSQTITFSKDTSGAIGDVTVFTTPSKLDFSDSSGRKIGICRIVAGHVRDCVPSSGSNLDEMMDAMYRAIMWESSYHQTEMENSRKSFDKVFSIAEQENKALKRCADQMGEISKQLKSTGK